MCGIAGVLHRHGCDRSIVEAMVERLVHRGPDDKGFYQDGPFIAGMRRLSINDVEGGQQPLFNTERTVAVFYNGEIYNSPALRKELEADGVRFRTSSDGEVISHLYDRYGQGVFEHLDGMYAISIWDSVKRELILARDIPGEKPLYYTMLNGNGLAFSSEVRSLLAHPGVDRTLDRRALWDYPTFLWIPEPNTTFLNVKALERGHYMVVKDFVPSVKSIKRRRPRLEEFRTDAEAIEATRTVVREAVFSRLLSDVPIGAFLSGGLDSAIVCAVARESIDELRTFCIGFEDVADPYHGKANEAPAAAETADFLGTKHHTISVTASDFGNLVDDFCYYADQPFAVSSGLGVLAISSQAQEEGVKVLLTGDGADEMFGGYSWYPMRPSIAALPPGVSRDQSVSMQSHDFRHGKGHQHLELVDQETRAWAFHYYASEDDKARLFSGEMRLADYDSREHFRDTATWDSIAYLDHDRRYYFPFEMLRKADRFTMARGIEGRVPFAAPGVEEHVNRLQWNHLIRGSTLKWCLRQAFKDVLPMAVIERPKHGFNVPVDAWLKGGWRPWMVEAFSPSSALSRAGIIDADSLAEAERLLYAKDKLAGHTLFSFVTLNRWLEGI